MLFLKFRRRVRKGASALLATLGTVAYFVLASGMPLPLGAAKDVSVAYPCMDCSCGCVSAEQCWDNCCCHTDVEKLIWAENHGVTPPAFVAERMRGAAQQLEKGDETAEKKAELATSCCSAKKSCCESKPQKPVEKPVASCCMEDDTCGETATPTCDEKENSGQQSVVLLQRMRCHGLSQINGLLPAIPLQSTSWMPYLIVSLFCEAPAALYHSLSEEPAVPPPQFC